MAKFYSPNGNIEVWAEKPNGYYTVEEWNALRPAPIDAPTTAEQIAQIDAQYEADKDELKSCYTEFLMRGDTEGQQAIKDELTALDTQYDADIAALNEEV